MLFKRGHHNNLSAFVITLGFYELHKDTVVKMYQSYTFLLLLI